MTENDMKEPFAVTYQTMSRIQNIHPNANIFFAAGTAKIRLIEEFTRKNDFLDRSGILAFARNGEDPYMEICRYETLLSHKDLFIIVKQLEGIDRVSSTAVRKHLFDIDMISDMPHPAIVPMLRKLDAADFPEEIIKFTGEYAFLDSSYRANVSFEGFIYPSVESVFQESKLVDNNDRKRFTQYGQDKTKQRRVSIVPNHG